MKTLLGRSTATVPWNISRFGHTTFTVPGTHLSDEAIAFSNFPLSIVMLNIRNIFRDSSIQVVSVGIAGVLSVLQTLIVARILGPKIYGILIVYRLVMTYATYADLGTLWAMVRDISFSRGKGDCRKIDQVKNITFTINIITLSLTGFAAFFIFFLHKNESNTFATLDVFIVTLLIIGQGISNFANYYFVALKQFLGRSILNILYPLCSVILILIVGGTYGLTGILCSMLFATILCLFYSLYKKVFKVKFCLPKVESINLLKQGLPICGNGMLSALFSSIDRLMIMWFLPLQYLGYYGIAVMIRSFIEAMYRSIYLAIFPYLSEKFGEKNDLEQIKGIIVKPLIISSHLTPFVLGPLVILIPSIIELLLPQYIPGTFATQVIIASSLFGCLQVGVINFFITIKKIQSIYILRIVATLVCAISSWLSIESGFGIEGVACSYLLSSIFLAVWLLHMFFKQYSIPINGEIRYLAILLYPFFYMALILFLTTYVKTNISNQHFGEMIAILFKIAFFLILCAPLVLLLNYFTGIYRLLKGKKL